MKQLKYYIRIYFIIISQYIKARMQFRADFIISSIGMLFNNIASIGTFWILFQSIRALEGWSFYEIAFIYGYSLLALTPLQLFFDNVWQLRNHLTQGTFIKFYFKPLNMMFYYMSEVFDLKGLSQFGFGLAVFIYASIKLSIQWTIMKFVLLIVTLFSSSLIMVSLMIIASSTGFWILNSNAVMSFTSKFREYARYPITIFTGFFKFLFSYIIPIGFIAFYPSQFFMRPKEFNVLVYFSPIAGIVFFIISYVVWAKGIKSYTGTGS